jgi:hypothetical protein
VLSTDFQQFLQPLTHLYRHHLEKLVVETISDSFPTKTTATSFTSAFLEHLCLVNVLKIEFFILEFKDVSKETVILAKEIDFLTLTLSPIDLFYEIDNVKNVFRNLMSNKIIFF